MLSAVNRSNVTPLIAAIRTCNQFVVATLLRLAKEEFSPIEYSAYVNFEYRAGVNSLSDVLNTQQQHPESDLTEYMLMAQMLIESGVQVSASTMSKIQAIENLPNCTALIKKVAKLAMTVSQDKFKSTKLGKLAPELFDKISKEAVRGTLVSKMMIESHHQHSDDDMWDEEGISDDPDSEVEM